MAVPEGYKSLGTVGIAYKGEYAPETPYKYLNCVYYQGSTYLALKDSPTGEPNNNGADWRYLAQGVVGPAAGFGKVTATVDDSTGTPHVEVSATGENTEKDITFTFTGLKGEQGIQGNVGEAAGFGSITATAENTAGPPTVSVKKSGENTAINLEFSFDGIKGEQGIQGVQGVSITNAKIKEDGHLHIILSNESDVDAGEIPLSKEGIIGALGYTPEPQPKQITKELTTTEWKNDQPLYTYEIPVSGLKATQLVYITANLAGKTKDDITNLIDAFSDACITAKEPQEEGKIVLQAISKPTTTLPIVIIVGGEPTDG